MKIITGNGYNPALCSFDSPLDQLIDCICAQGEEQVEEMYEYSPFIVVKQSKGLLGYKDIKGQDRSSKLARFGKALDEWKAFCDKYGIALDEGNEEVTYYQAHEKVREETTRTTLCLTVSQQMREAVVRDECARQRQKVLAQLKRDAGEWYGRLSGTAAADAVTGKAVEWLRKYTLSFKEKYPTAGRVAPYAWATKTCLENQKYAADKNRVIATYEDMGYESLQSKEQVHAINALIIERAYQELSQEDSLLDVGVFLVSRTNDYGSRWNVLCFNVCFKCEAGDPAPKLQSWT